ncbi:transcriptional regulator [Alkalispirochaeta sphaeroplastigenens]|uniref:Transcriptional regulator n=1 Tax=Alkalispirochaeta sphaeroplastigenens TaxID=1187066 RepID=A0A2S4JN54_9SPIO|nr:ROK family protein [Alkalispirochaeta sphaeroplastigenens]POR00958.1 transcriptional regulator [Alkalispirochaeta sphaeroplastigenens]
MHHPLRSYDIRQSNEKLVLKMLFEHRSISQSHIVHQTGLKAPTVYRIFSKLENAGFIEPCRTEDVPEEMVPPERKGRRPSFYRVVSTSAYALGIDFSSLGVAVILVDFRNTVIFRENQEFTAGPDRGQILTVIEKMVRRALDKTGIATESILGIALAAPGVVNTEEGRVREYPRIADLEGFPLGEHFSAIFGVPVYVHNNATVIASSAFRYGAARDTGSLLALLVRSGIGGALINQGEIFLSGASTALEVGRTTLEAGSWEDLAGDRRPLEARVAEIPLLQRLQERFSLSSWIEAGQRLSLEEVEQVLQEEQLLFGATLRNMVHLLDPEAVLIMSRFRLLSDFLARAAERAVPHKKVISLVYDPVQACYGATDIVFQQFFRVVPGE